MADDRNENPPQCPKCQSEYSYADGILWICPECAHEWSSSATAEATEQNEVRDAHGNRLVGGDHNIDCRIEGIGPMKLKSEFVKKA